MRKQLLPIASAAVIAMALPGTIWSQSVDILETVFIPTDEAFAKLPPGKLAALMKDKSALKEVLLYHVVTGTVMAADIAKLNGKGKKTAEGSDAKIMMMGSGIMVNNANVTKADIMASNGVIHVIDAVMLPPGS